MENIESGVIDKFRNEHYFLSNMYTTPAPVVFEGLSYKTSEAAYQAAKTEDEDIRKQFTKLGPKNAKKLGRSLELRKDWNNVKLKVMKKILKSKFSSHKMRDALLETKDKKLVEGNWWNDTYWGVCRGKGENHLGNLLMTIREELEKQKPMCMCTQCHQ